MKIYLPLTIAGVSLLALLFARGNLSRALKRLGAKKPDADDSTWQKVQQFIDLLARRQRRAAPELWILPDLSPNAVAFCTLRGKRILLISEGLFQILEPAEREAALVLAICHAHRPFARLQSMVAVNSLPFFSTLESSPAIFQAIVAPLVLFLLRLFVFSRSFLWVDREATRWADPLALAAALQKMAVVGQKVPVRRWSLVLDHLYLISPLILSGNSFWLTLPQVSVAVRRNYVLTQLSCERAPTLS